VRNRQGNLEGEATVMRAAKPSIIIGVIGALAFSTMAVAGALISGASGQVIQLTSAPPSVAVDVEEDATNAIAFDERQAVTLESTLLVDATGPGTYRTWPNGRRTIAAGTEVDSHLIHSDPSSAKTGIHRTGTVTFASPIIGVIGATDRLAASDAALGAPGTTYAGATSARGLESQNQDNVTVSADGRTLSFDIRTAQVIDDLRVITRHVDVLDTVIFDTPDPVTAGNDVQYTLVVTNAGYSSAPNAHVVDTLPADTTVVTASAPGGCTGTGPVDCTLGPLAVGESAIATIVLTVPGTVPDGGTITNTAVASPGANVAATETTTVEAPAPGVSKGFVGPGDSIDTGGDEPALLTLPSTGDGAPVLITQGPGTFCDGPCTGTATTISDFDGYDDPNHPIRLRLTFSFPSSPTSLTDAATAFGSTIYKNDDPDHPNAGVPVADCTNPGSGVAAPHPCVDGHTITQPTPNSFLVTFDIVYLSGDPRFALR
jgi:uncharacterized repeat protein (TIGR01451 family)